MFIRPDPSETPRPPDLSGKGLGKSIDINMAARAADPARTRPTYALVDLYTPDDDDSSGPVIKDDVGELLLSRGKVIIENGQYKGKPGEGKFIKRGQCATA